MKPSFTFKIPDGCHSISWDPADDVSVTGVWFSPDIEEAIDSEVKELERLWNLD